MVLLLPWVAIADTQPATYPRAYGCKKLVLCDALPAASVGVCTGSNGDEIVANLTGLAADVTFDSQQSTGTRVCDIYSNDTGYDASGGVGHKINETSLTAATPKISLGPGSFEYVWISCPSIEAANTATVTAIACPFAR